MVTAVGKWPAAAAPRSQAAVGHNLPERGGAPSVFPAVMRAVVAQRAPFDRTVIGSTR